MTTAKMKFLLSYNMKIIGRWGDGEAGGGEGVYETLVWNNNLVEEGHCWG